MIGWLVLFAIAYTASGVAVGHGVLRSAQRGDELPLVLGTLLTAVMVAILWPVACVLDACWTLVDRRGPR